MAATQRGPIAFGSTDATSQDVSRNMRRKNRTPSHVGTAIALRTSRLGRLSTRKKEPTEIPRTIRKKHLIPHSLERPDRPNVRATDPAFLFSNSQIQPCLKLEVLLSPGLILCPNQGLSHIPRVLFIAPCWKCILCRFMRRICTNADDASPHRHVHG